MLRQIFYPIHATLRKTLLVSLLLVTIFGFSTSLTGQLMTPRLLAGNPAQCVWCGRRGKIRRFLSPIDDFITKTEINSLTRVGIVGGGLAGLSTAYHLLQKQPTLDITILDVTSGPGEGGASSVAGGLLHPLSPRGKLVYMGLEGLASTNGLIQVARQFAPECVLREDLYRVALDEKQRDTLRGTAEALPHLTKWIDDTDKEAPNEWESLNLSDERVLGALKMHNGCKVIHVPSYLSGLWDACQSTGSGSKAWVQDQTLSETFTVEWKSRLSGFDCVVFSGGAGMFQSSVLGNDNELPIQLVRGQSIEMTVSSNQLKNALLGGKYVSPMLEPDKILVGATHEFKEEPLSQFDVVKELKDRSYAFCSTLWDHGSIDRITSGSRVQSQRGRYGRLPIIGRIQCPHHSNSWIFTGLSSRGILYHGIYGDALSGSILGQDNNVDRLRHLDVEWWKK
ncbi:FAD dependent oxidoreductase [Nitzschia inconspicua]|uniref:FAD dependent oxidoreductase n=1 Tax=Nitzschia inconspicua TaxID=303405 RepID=A0A9K3L4M2_9STRA|nr:FAD dependent oxidoreductase [Nitzschia inconspicua]